MPWPFHPQQEHDPVPGAAMPALTRAHDWHATPLGPPDGWPRALTCTLATVLACRLPMILAWGPSHIHFYNDAAIPVFGAKHPAALGAPGRAVWAEIWHIVEPMWREVMAGGTVGGSDFHVAIARWDEPEDRSFDFSYSPVLDDDGRVGGVLVTFVDTTDTVMARQRLAFRLALADALRGLDDADAAIGCATRMLGTHLGADRMGFGEYDEATDIVHIGRDWTSGKAVSLAGARLPLAAFGADVRALLLSGGTLRVDDVTRDARTAAQAQAYAAICVGAVLAVPLVRERRCVAILYVHAVGPRRWTDAERQMAEDVAGRIWDAVQRVRAEEALRAADRRKDEFLAMLAHELRNPLAPITTAAELLQRGSADAARVTQASGVIVRQAAHMKALVDDLLDVSRVTRGQVALQRETLDLRDVADMALEQNAPTLARRGHVLTVVPAPDALPVHGDRVRLVQVLSNLLNNAARYTPEGGRIVLALGGDAAHVEAAVEDNGPGIPADLLPHVFDLFVQGVRSPDRAQGGLGLGLALARTLVALHGGSIAAGPGAGGCGARIVVRLPRATGDAPSQAG
jgi:signal transduction histidine kinase